MDCMFKSCFGFEGWTRILVASFPDFCILELLFYLSVLTRLTFNPP